MSRPLRIEFPGAWYHVMNRGAGYREIFYTDSHRDLFLDLLSELDSMFRVETHGYCLMDNHYHLITHTPEGNLQRAMRHLNGVYTQRFNRSEETDGPLFRGRYKALLIEPDAYLLNVSRYIHLNPVAARLTRSAGDYRWSSYPAYIGKERSPHWLKTGFIRGILGRRRQRSLYRAFVEMGVDDKTQAFYDQRKWAPVLGNDGFRERIRALTTTDPEIPEARSLKAPVSLSMIVDAVSDVFATPKEDIMKTAKGRGKKNHARAAAIYCARKMGGFPLNEIAEYFNLNHYGSVSGAVNRFLRLTEENPQFNRLVRKIEKRINEQI